LFGWAGLWVLFLLLVVVANDGFVEVVGVVVVLGVGYEIEAGWL
jgi:hypothetical protein